MLSPGQELDERFLDSKHGLKVYFKPSRNNQDFLFLPLPSKLASMRNDHLSATAVIVYKTKMYYPHTKKEYEVDPSTY